MTTRRFFQTFRRLQDERIRRLFDQVGQPTIVPHGQCQAARAPDLELLDQVGAVRRGRRLLRLRYRIDNNLPVD